MPVSKKPRKRYRPMTGDGFIKIPAVIRYRQQEETALQLVPHSELDKFRRGLADETTYHTLAFRLNWGYVMAGEFFDALAQEAMARGLDAIRSVRERHERLGKWGTTGPEFEAMGYALNLTDEMQQKTTRKEQLHAIRIVTTVNDFKHLRGQVADKTGAQL